MRAYACVCMRGAGAYGQSNKRLAWSDHLTERTGYKLREAKQISASSL